MNDWNQLNEKDTAKVKQGGAWAFRDGELVQVSGAAMVENIKAMLPAVLTKLSGRLSVESWKDVEDIDVVVADDLSAVTVSLYANGHVAVEERKLHSPVVQ